MTDAEIAWLAGIFEGEGTTYTQTKNLTSVHGVHSISTTVRVSIVMTDLDIIERIQNLFPAPSGITTRKRGPEYYKPQYEWRISQRDLVARFLRLILPWLGQRRTQRVSVVLAIAEDPDRGLGSGHRNKTHCRNGHQYDDDNTTYNQDGHRSCKACRRLQSQQRRARAKSL